MQRGFGSICEILEDAALTVSRVTVVTHNTVTLGHKSLCAYVEMIMPFEMSCGHCGNILYWGIDVKSPREVLKQEGFRCRNCGVKLCQEFDVDVDSSGNIIHQVSTQRASKRDQQSIWPPSTKKR